ncbi:putative F-box and WD40 domain protein [Cladophialophora carrionii]|uniref:Probable E3 ubiquitin ligase complex SCF subunit sconB n=1 Tax=Cladophialophora carrionii TaxID=86049 RepID=A0A1C1CZG4_9EURO|nr:putative F-box and WD40 domain protein [Cladophialophora carrionii]
MSHPEPASIAPWRRTSLRAHSRPQTAYDSFPNVEGSFRRPATRMSFVMPPTTAHDVLDWGSFVRNQEQTGVGNNSPDFIDPFSKFASEPQTTETARPRRYSSISQSFRQSISEIRSLTRRMSLTVRGKSSKQKEELVEPKRPQLPLFKSGTDMMGLTEAMSTRPKSRGRMLRTPSARRRPSLPLLHLQATPDSLREAENPTNARSRGQPFLSDLVYGGAEARAAAAAQNELFHATRAPPLPPYEPPQPKDDKVEQDAESGIGIVLDTRTRRGSSPANVHVVRQDPVTVLATELVETILSFLDVESVMQASLVCHRWHDLCQSQAVWRRVFLREYAPKSRAPVAGMRLAGLGKNRPGQDYRKLFQVRTLVDKRWRNGEAAAIYLNGHKDSVYCCQFDEHKIVTGSRDNTIRVWDAHTYQCIRKLGPPNNPRERQSVQVPLVEPEGVLPFFKAYVDSPGPQSPELPLYHQASVLCLQYDDEILVTGSSDYSCLVWSIKDDYKPMFRLVGHHAGVLDVCIDKDRIVTCSKDTTIKIWERSSGRLIRTLLGHRGPVNAVQVRGNFLASASGDGMSKLWRLEDGVCIKEFPSKDRGLACVEFSENGRTIFAGGNDQVIYEYDTVTGQRIREMQGHKDLVRSLHLDSANKRIVSGSYDHSIKVWDAEKGESAQDGGLKINFEGWSSSWILAAKSNYRKIVCTSQDARVVIIDFGYGIDGVDLVES